MLNTVHIVTFLTVAELGTYSAAAERLHLTQPAVSQQLRLLEQELGDVRLFRRVGQRMILTHAGEQLLPGARELIGLAERMTSAMQALRGQVSGYVRVACPPGTGELVLPAVLAAFQQRWPAVRLSLEIAATPAIIDGLAARDLDIGWIDESVRRRGWECLPAASEPLVFCIPPTHPWYGDPLITVGMLSEVPLLLPPQGSAARRAIDEALRRAGLDLPRLQHTLECASPQALAGLIDAGAGLGWLPRSAQMAAHSAQSGAPGGLNIHIDWFVVGSKDPALSRAVHDCRAFLSGREAMALLQQQGLQPPR